MDNAMEAEEDFPRGGAEAAQGRPGGGKGLRKKAQTGHRGKSGGQKMGYKGGEFGVDGIEAVIQKQPTFVETIRFKTLNVGTKLWGAVLEANEKELVVSLPNGLKGYVSISEASDFSMEIDENDVDTAAYEVLGKLYASPGMLVPCVVVGLGTRETLSSKTAKRIELSLKLSRLHAGLTREHFQEGMVTWGYVKSVEDHGYLLSFGLPDITGFLPFKEHKAEGSQEAAVLRLGQMLKCVVGPMDKERHVVMCKTNSNLESSAMMPQLEGITLQSLLPGQLVSGKVQGVLKDGLSLSFLTYFTGTVSLFHLETPLLEAEWQKTFAVNKRVRARVLMVDPVNKAVALTLNKSLVADRLPEINVSVGDIFEEAVVSRVDASLGLVLSLDRGAEKNPMAAFVHVSNVSEQHVDKLEKKFKPGQKVRARVIGKQSMDGMATATMKESVVDQLILSIADVSPGMIVKGKLVALKPAGAVVRLGEGVRALCPLQHMAESSLTKPPPKFKTGAVLRFRVVSVDLDRKKITLTHKRTMVTSKLPPLTCQTDAKEGIVTHGWVSGVEAYGVFVCFYGTVKGLVHRSHMGLPKDASPLKVFKQGQVVKCRVRRQPVAAEDGKLSLSFDLSENM